MSIRPILSALLRNKTGAILVAVQVALTLAVVVNSTYIIMQRIEKIGRPTGLDESNIFMVNTLSYAQDFPAEASIRADLTYLNGLPGVVAATSINAIPLSGGGSSTSYFTEPGEKGEKAPGNYFEVTERGIDLQSLRPWSRNWLFQPGRALRNLKTKAYPLLTSGNQLDADHIPPATGVYFSK